MAFTGYSQLAPIRFEHLTTANGLAQNTITGITKDKYGFMWFGTWGGLCRYDGYKFKVYRHEKNKPGSLVHSRVYNVAVDQNKDLWVVTFNDSLYCKYRYETDDFVRIPKKQLDSTFARSISRNGHLFNAAVSYKGFVWDLDRTDKDLKQLEKGTGKMLRFKPDPLNPWSINDQFATDLYLDNQHVLWVGTYSNGINKASLDTRTFQHITQQPSSTQTIIDKNVHTISADLNGNLWVGTRNKGISVISKAGTYRHFQQQAAAPNAISHDNIKTIFCDSKGYTWIGTHKGLNRYDPETGKMSQIMELGLNEAHVFSIIEDQKGNLLFATWSGIFKYLSHERRMIRLRAPGLPVNFAMAISQDHHHNIWIGTESNGAAVFTYDGDTTLRLKKRFHVGAEQGNDLSDDQVYSIIEDRKHRIWIGTANGVDVVDEKLNIFKRIGASPKELASATISSIIEDNQGFIWVNHTRGISRIHPKSFSVRNFSMEDGLGNNFSDGNIYKSHSGVLYFGGNNGFNYFSPDQIKTDRSLNRVLLTELQVLNKTVNVNDTINGRVLLAKPLYLSRSITLNHLDRSISFEFAAMNMVNPGANRYAYMLEGFDKDWVYTDASNRTAVYANLARGHYVFKVKASNSDGVWSNDPTQLDITVLAPWWASRVAYFIYVLLFLAIVYGFNTYALRVEKLKNKLAYENHVHEQDLIFHQEKINFYTNISHEIKTPLTLILAPIERMMLSNEVTTRMQEQLQTMKNSGARLLKLVNELLDIRRLETGNDKLQLRDVNLNSLVARVLASFTDAINEKNISLIREEQTAALYCRVDEDKLEKILYNLLSNALKFTGQNGTIKVMISHTPLSEQMSIEVGNDGMLIEQEDLTRIFAPFQQGNHQQGGTGLGLAYSKSLVTLHGGSLSAQSGKNAAGENYTSFLLNLPFIKPEESMDLATAPIDIFDVPQQEDRSSQSTSLGENTPSLLVVEDNPELRQYICQFFSETYRVIAANNGAEGLKYATEQVPDLIISDLMMPEMDGLCLCRAIKSGVATNHIPFILLTARTPLELQLESAESGADEYITKPFNLELLSLKVRNLLSLRKTLQEKYQKKVSLNPTTPAIQSPDEKLLQKIWAYVDEKIGDPDLDISEICDSIGLSRTQLYRKMKVLTGLSMAEMIRDYRLERAKQLLAGKKFNVNEVCYLVGFNDVAYFRKLFKAKTGQSPSDYAKNGVSE